MWIWQLIVVILVLAVQANVAVAKPERVDIRSRSVRRQAAARIAKRDAGKLELLAAFDLGSNARHFGGLSGATLAATGKTLWAVSDLGRWYRLPLRHDEKGVLSGVGLAKSGPLLGVDGKPLVNRFWDFVGVGTQRPSSGMASGFWCPSKANTACCVIARWKRSQHG
jgi:hypothetical protein